MMKDDIQDILSLVERPSRYLGNEVNRRRKACGGQGLHFALAFPDVYEIGMSHFGIQILYHVLNAHPNIAAERVFAPAADMQVQLEAHRRPLVSLETHAPLKAFDVIGFSLLYELNFTNVLLMLDLAEIPLMAQQRDMDVPLIIGGGPCTVNPEPLSDFFDAVVIGDGESVILEMARKWLRAKQNGVMDKSALLAEWSTIDAVYVPSRHPVRYDQNGFQHLVHDGRETRLEQSVARRAIESKLDRTPFPTHPIVPFGKPIHDRLRLEIARGCSRGCRFCQAGMIYRPVRERPLKQLLALAHASLKGTGYEDLSLLSLSAGDYSCMPTLLSRLMASLKPQRIAVSLPSLRAETLTPQVMAQIKSVRKTGFTIAPEAGSQRLRDAINKNISEKQIIDAVRNAFDLGWRVVKLYFMTGLPTETDEDTRAIVDLVKTLLRMTSGRGGKGRLNVSIATFIPKAHTPFQWATQLDLSAAKHQMETFRKRLDKTRIHFKWQHPEVSWIEGLFARGDRRLGGLLVAAYRAGCRFDGWSDRFRFDAWQKAFDMSGVDPDRYMRRKRSTEEPLPWDHIDMRIEKAFLKNEWQKAHAAATTADCRSGACHQCGVCDGEGLKPQLAKLGPEEIENPDQAAAPSRPNGFRRLKIGYSKTGPAKYFGHLELVNIFTRALRRASIVMQFSGGFHPLPKISFQNPLPVGTESREECFFLKVAAETNASEVKVRLNRTLPEGLHVHDCRIVDAKTKSQSRRFETYTISCKDKIVEKTRIDAFYRSHSWTIQRKNKKGRIREIDLRERIQRLHAVDDKRLIMTLNVDGGVVRPSEVLKAVFAFSEPQIRQAAIVKESSQDV